MASRSAKQPHVRFASELTVPPADRLRKNYSFYPKVAQEKGHSERQSSFDLFWQWDRLSSVPHGQEGRQQHQSKRLATESLAVLEARDCAALFSVSGGVPQDMRQRKLDFAGFGLGALSRATCKRAWRETLRLPLQDILKRPQPFPQTVPLRDHKSATIDTSRWADSLVNGWT